MGKHDAVLEAVLKKHPMAKHTVACLIEAADRHLRKDFARDDVNELRALDSTNRALTCRRGAKYVERVAFHLLNLDDITVSTENYVWQSLWVALAVRESFITSLQNTRNGTITHDFQPYRPLDETLEALNKEQV